jgi:di/tricarboxylate transporter
VLHVRASGFAAGRTLAEVRKRTGQRMRIDRIARGDGLLPVKEPSVQLQAGDRLYVRDTADNLKEFERLLGATLYNASDISTPVIEVASPDEEGLQLAEAVISRSSPLHNRTLNAAHFSKLYNLMPLAIHRSMSGADLSEDLSNIRLQAGDVLLVQGAREAIAELRSSGSILVLDGTIDLPHTDRAPWALVILLMVVLMAAFGLLPMSLSALVGVAAMLLTRCLRWRDLGPALSMPLILLVAASLSLGDALTVTGGIDYIAQLFVAGFGGMPVPVILSGLMLLLILATNIVTNNTVAVIGVPIAISMARQLGVPAEPFVVAAIFAANMSYATPIGYQGNLLIMSAGGYKFADFVRVGVPLTVIVWLTFSFFLLVWPLISRPAGAAVGAPSGAIL